MVINFVIVINNESFIQNINFVYVVYKFKKLKFKFILSYDIYYKRIKDICLIKFILIYLICYYRKYGLFKINIMNVVIVYVLNYVDFVKVFNYN